MRLQRAHCVQRDRSDVLGKGKCANIKVKRLVNARLECNDWRDSVMKKMWNSVREEDMNAVDSVQEVVEVTVDCGHSERSQIE